ncbi:acyl-[acyl-carrier-protein] thioesterase [Clostridium lundense]|uniref:acyl-[acyl-carrier-protein] thioesterase n=1 Tax=Clostridium lundense TaxID=319475 RepID=UPI00048028C5|nr:acyl-ACP thioesterase domain-containing protein [Clostridium lundense]
MENLVTEKEYEIHYYEVDYKRRVLITNIINYFCDVATKQSEDRNVGLDYMRENNIAWVLYKWHIDVHRYPLHGEKVIVTTRPHSFRKFYGYRKFQIIDEKGEIIVEANSIWFLIDIKKRRPKRINDYILEAYKVSKDNDERGILEIPDIACVESIDNEKTFNVRYSDIDTNGHVNNVKYVSWAIETVPLEIIKNYALKSITINYEKETKYGEIINAFVQIIKEDKKIICIHKITDKEGNELTIAQSIWKQ